ncbi:MAG: hypothetical protein ACYDBY_21775 [Thermoanaerobaculia bacterium]
MRSRRAIGLLLLLGAAAIVATWLLDRRLEKEPPRDPVRLAWAATAHPNVAFVLDASRPLVYSIPDGTRTLRLLVNANLPSETLEEGLSPDRPRRPRSFKVEMEETGPRGRPVDRRTWTFLAENGAFRDPKDGALRPSMFYLDSDHVASTSYEVLLDVGLTRRVKGLTLRLGESDPGIHDVIVRAFTPIDASDSRVAHGWDQLSDPIRIQLLSGNVYPEGLLRDEEKRNLLSRPWESLAPRGTWRSQPPKRVLYQELGDLEPDAGTAYEPHGLKVDATRQAVLHVPMAGARIRLDVRGWGPPPPATSDSSLGIHWIGPGLGQRSSRRVPWPGEDLAIEETWEGGYLIVDATRLGFVRAYRRTPDGEEEITPPEESLGCALLEAGREVEYSVPPAAGGPIPFRIDLRRVLTSPDASTARTWLYRDQIASRRGGLDLATSPVVLDLLDGKGKTIRSERLPLDSAVSPLDELPSTFGTARLGLPTTTALLLPLATRTVRVRLDGASTAGAVLVAGYNRIPGRPRERVVPDDFFRFDTRETRVPSWLTVLPERHDELLAEKRWTPIATQPLPDAEDEELLAGAFELDALKPVDRLPGKELLAPRDANSLPPSEDGLTEYYAELPTARETSVTLRGSRGLKSLRPSLLRIGPSLPATATLTLDGAPFATFRALSPVQEMVLPPVPTGSHRVRVDVPDGSRLFLNHQWPGPAGFAKRLAHPLETGRPLVFAHERTSPSREGLSLRFYAPSGEGTEIVLGVELVGPSVPPGVSVPALTPTSRRLRLRLGADRTALLLHGPGTRFARTPVAPLLLGPDLPPGRYRIECVLESGPPGLVTLSRSQAGLRSRAVLVRDDLEREAP